MANTEASKRFHRQGVTKYGLRIDVTDDGVRFAVTSNAGAKVHATATLALEDAADATAFVAEARRAARRAQR